MRLIIFCLTMICGGAAVADELADANAALAAKAYPAAVQGFSKLAQAGNPEAQLRLGEMYWYGEGVALDRARGDKLFAQAAAAGNKDAVAAQTLSARRLQRGADIAFWTSGYDGADLTAGKFSCVEPVLPEISKTNEEIKAANAAVAKWQSCYNGFAENLNDAQPAGKRIPAEVAVLMSEQEAQQAREHLSKVYGTVIDKAQANAAATVARHEQWLVATVASVEAQNRTNEARTKQVKMDLDRDRMLRESSTANNRPPPRSTR